MNIIKDSKTIELSKGKRIHLFTEIIYICQIVLFPKKIEKL